MTISNLIKSAVAGDPLPECALVSYGDRQSFDAWSRAGIVHGEEPPATLRDIIDAIASRRGVTLYREAS